MMCHTHTKSTFPPKYTRFPINNIITYIVAIIKSILSFFPLSHESYLSFKSFSCSMRPSLSIWASQFPLLTLNLSLCFDCLLNFFFKKSLYFILLTKTSMPSMYLLLPNSLLQLNTFLITN